MEDVAIISKQFSNVYVVWLASHLKSVETRLFILFNQQQQWII